MRRRAGRCFPRKQLILFPVVARLDRAIQAALAEGMGGRAYILASGPYGTLYIGVANDITRRIFEHIEGEGSEFRRRYGVARLVYYEFIADIRDAIRREKRLKKWNRAWKGALIEKLNPN